jgi:hypothetical protein
VPGAAAGAVLWAVAATCLLVAYYLGYEALYLGLLCGTGKWGLGWFAPPARETQDAVRGWVLPLTAFAFTFGVGCAAAAGATLARLVAILRRIATRKRDGEPNPPA